MAGHSKWKNIQHRKSRQDAKRAKIFTKISKEIYMAAKNGGPDPTTNAQLRMAIQKAKDANMPAENIERTIKKATGGIEGVTYESITYEGYGPGGVAVMVEVLTDNRNRSAAAIRHIFTKHGGNLGETGCVSYLFNRKGQLVIDREQYEGGEEDVMMVALEAGAEDLETSEETFIVYTAPEDVERVREALVQAGIPVSSAEVTLIPTTYVSVTGETAEKIVKMMEMFEDNDDVQNVYANFEMDDEELAKLSS